MRVYILTCLVGLILSCCWITFAIVVAPIGIDHFSRGWGAGAINATAITIGYLRYLRQQSP